MFKIGDFSRFSRVSVKMLRHYDRLGLLAPERVDPFTGYRYYSAAQLPRLQRILALRDMGFGLEQIRSLLDEALSADEMHAVLEMQRAGVRRQLQEEAARLSRIEALLAQLEAQDGPPPFDVVLRAVDAQQIAAIRAPIDDSGTGVGPLFEELEAYVARHLARRPQPPLLLYHDAEFQDGAQDLEVAVPVEPATLPSGHTRVRVRELAGHPAMACVVHSGGYETLATAFAALLTWIESNEYQIDGPTREVYLRFGADQSGYRLHVGYLAASADEFVTELQIPVTKL